VQYARKGKERAAKIQSRWDAVGTTPFQSRCSSQIAEQSSASARKHQRIKKARL
jgi:hypothetical protein